MIVKALIENTSKEKGWPTEHGISIYIESNEREIVFDVGASKLFLQNAKTLDVDISNVDYLIISHGHSDHGGGLETFLNENNEAKVFVHPRAFDKFFFKSKKGKLHYVGLKEELKDSDQIVFTDEHHIVEEGIELFSNIDQIEPRPLANAGLLMEEEGEAVDDDFTHEQSLIVEEGGKALLITGCAHNGIVNIIDKYVELKGRAPDYVIGGFHLFNTALGVYESEEGIEKMGKALLETGSKYYTCHCTGTDAYEKLKDIMGNNIEYLSTGEEIEL